MECLIWIQETPVMMSKYHARFSSHFTVELDLRGTALRCTLIENILGFSLKQR